MTEDNSMGGLGDLLRQAQELQAQLASAQEQAAERVVEGQAGGGAVRIAVTGGLEFRKVTIDPAAVDPADVPMLEDLVLAALHDAMAAVGEMAQEAVGSVGGGLFEAFGSMFAGGEESTGLGGLPSPGAPSGLPPAFPENPPEEGRGR